MISSRLTQQLTDWAFRNCSKMALSNPVVSQIKRSRSSDFRVKMTLPSAFIFNSIGHCRVLVYNIMKSHKFLPQSRRKRVTHVITCCFKTEHVVFRRRTRIFKTIIKTFFIPQVSWISSCLIINRSRSLLELTHR